MQLYTDDDADLSVVQARNVAVIGHGGQALAHSLCLRDSGVDVRVGLSESSPERAEVDAAGLPVLAPYDACEEADLIVLVSSEPQLRSLYAEAVEPNLVPGDAVLFDSGLALRFGLIKPAGDVDVVMVAPEGSGGALREEFEAGRGVPVLVAVEQDASGHAEDLALSYARAIGGLRTAAIKTTMAEQGETALFAEQVVFGGVTALVQRGLEALTQAGYAPEVASLRCVRELQRAATMLTAGDPVGRAATSETTEQEGYTGGRYVVDDSVAQRMGEVLRRIRDGSWTPDMD